FFPTPVF
ncbi:hypothetical protein D047_3818B, partial [Vibrio parahaemolyticus VPTS-2010_2]